MAGGASEAGDDMVVGRRNESDDSTSLNAVAGDSGVYGDDYVLKVSTADGVFSRRIDAIIAEGQTSPAASGVVSRGLNGTVGYVHAVTRDVSLEDSIGAGVVGVGGGASAGTFGSGQNGVVGYEQTTPRDLAFEASQRAGVLGRGERGVSGDGANGAGVFGRGLPGVQGESEFGPGVRGEGANGVDAIGSTGAGLTAFSKSEQAAVLRSVDVAQLLLDPIRIKDPTSLRRSNAGELVATIWPQSDQSDARDVASLWFCTFGGDGKPGTANWVRLA
jgi:hypothetical protein